MSAVQSTMLVVLSLAAARAGCLLFIRSRGGPLFFRGLLLCGHASSLSSQLDLALMGVCHHPGM